MHNKFMFLLLIWSSAFLVLMIFYDIPDDLPTLPAPLKKDPTTLPPAPLKKVPPTPSAPNSPLPPRPTPDT